MPAVTNGSTKTIQVGTKDKKMEFVVSLPYHGGQTINDIEAKVLNQIRCENIGNNIRSRVQATMAEEKDSMSEPELRAWYDKYEADYVFTEAAAGTGRAQLTPLEREARNIAKSLVIMHISKPTEKYPKGRKQKDIDPEAFEAQVAQFADHEQVVSTAKKNLAAKAKVAENLLASLQAG